MKKIKLIFLVMFQIFSLNYVLANDTVVKTKTVNDTLFIKLTQSPEEKSLATNVFVKNFAVPIVSVLSAIGAFFGVFLQVKANNKAKEKELKEKLKYEILKSYSDLIASLNLEEQSVKDNLKNMQEPSVGFFQNKTVLISLLKGKSELKTVDFENKLNFYKKNSLGSKSDIIKWISDFSSEFQKLVTLI